MEKIRFGIIGIGNMGIKHLNSFYQGKIENAVCTAIADRNPAKIEAGLKQSPGEYEIFSDGMELIEKANIDAVLIAVPHYDHPALSIAAMKRGIAVVCEKPAGVYTKQVKEMNRVAKETGVPFTMMYNQRTNPLYRKMHDLIASGEMGEIRRVNWIVTNWFRTQFYYDSGSWRATWSGEGGGVLLNQCPHQLDLMQWICGMMPDTIRAFCHFGKWHDIEVEDDVTAYMEFPNGATGAFITSTGDTPGSNRFEIVCSKGSLVCEQNALTIRRLEVDAKEWLHTATDGFAQPPVTQEVIPWSRENDPSHNGILNNFANHLLGLEALYVAGTEGIHCVELMDAMLLSTFQSKTVSLPIDDEEYWTELSSRIATSRKKPEVDLLIDNSSSYGGTK